MVKVSASLLAKPEEMEKGALVKKIKDLESAGIDEIHFDVMDGGYNPNNTWDYQGPDVIKDLRGITKLPFVAHLMVGNPLEKVGLFCDVGCDVIVFHYEACKEIRLAIDRIKSSGRNAGMAIEPETPIEVISPYLSEIGYALVMTVRTGYHGQGFMDKTDKIRYLAARKEKFEICVDGGINDITGKLCRDAGATVLAAASYISNSKDYAVAIKTLRGLQHGKD